jgi:ligand-binding sensor domain-containing protein
MKKLIYSVVIVLSLVCFNVNAQWLQTNGPYGGIVNCLTVQGANIFAGTYNNGVLRSSDNGVHWTAVNNGLTDTRILSFVVTNNNIFAGTENGLFLSTDSGDNWTAVNSGFPGPPMPASIKALAVSGTNLFAADFFFNGGGVFISTDNGTNWTNTNLTNPFTEALAVNGSNLFAGTNGYGIFLTTDNGVHWATVNSGLTDTVVSALAVNGNNIFAGTSTGVFLSTNNGANWTAINSNLPVTKVSSFTISGSNIYAGTSGKGVYLSTNNGTDWNPVNSGLINPTIHGLTASGTSIFAGTHDGGVFLSTDNGENWIAVNKGFPNTDVYSLYVIGNTVFAGTEGGGVYSSSDSGNYWDETNSGLTHPYILSFASSSTNLFVGTYGGGVFRSSDNGSTWNSANSGIPPVQSYINTIAINEPKIFVGTKYGIFLSTDEGTNWNWVGLSNYSILSIAIIGESIFAATPNNGVFLSTNDGINWTNVNNGLTNTHMLSLAVSGGNIFAGTYYGGGVYSGGIFCSSDNGQNWTPAGLEGRTVFCLLVRGIYLIAGTDGYAFVSADSGATWNNIGDGLMYSWVHALTATNTDLYAGTGYNGVLRRALSEIVSVKDPFNDKLKSFELQQNYPNPFNPSTSIEYAIGSRQFVQLKVYDVLGNEIATLVDEEKSPGSYEVEFQSSVRSLQLASGMYFYQLKAGDPESSSGQVFVQTKKMILIR